LIWGSEKQKYFFKEGWTAQIGLIRFKKLVFRRKGVFARRAGARQYRRPATILRSCGAILTASARFASTSDGGWFFRWDGGRGEAKDVYLDDHSHV
jgi:hypothetical protein